MKMIKFTLIAALAAVLSGCDPDDVEFSVTTDDLCAAMNGEVGESECVVTFDTMMGGDNLRGKIPDIKKKIQPLLGSKGKINVRGDKLVATFKAKVVGKEGTITEKEGPYRIVVANDGIVSYQTTRALSEINEAIKEIDFSLSFDDNPKQVTWRLSSDETPATVKAIAVFVDGVGKLTYKELISGENERELVFSRDAHSVYSQVPISFTISK